MSLNRGSYGRRFWNYRSKQASKRRRNQTDDFGISVLPEPTQTDDFGIPDLSVVSDAPPVSVSDQPSLKSDAPPIDPSFNPFGFSPDAQAAYDAAVNKINTLQNTNMS